MSAISNVPGSSDKLFEGFRKRSGEIVPFRREKIEKAGGSIEVIG